MAIPPLCENLRRNVIGCATYGLSALISTLQLCCQPKVTHLDLHVPTAHNRITLHCREHNSISMCTNNKYTQLYLNPYTKTGSGMQSYSDTHIPVCMHTIQITLPINTEKMYEITHMLTTSPKSTHKHRQLQAVTHTHMRAHTETTTPIHT